MAATVMSNLRSILKSLEGQRQGQCDWGKHVAKGLADNDSIFAD
jgi:hypothetical protein